MAIETTPVNNKQQQQSITAATSNPNGALGQDAFMKLLVAELKNQDPSDPMNSRDTVAQLATLSQVEKMTSMDEKLGSLQNITAAAAGIQNAGLIGRKVEADTKNLSLADAGAAGGGVFNLNNNAATVQVKIRDSSGTSVKTIDMGSLKLGPQQVKWDGTNDQGKRAPTGLYTFQITAKDSAGQPVVATTKVSGMVTKVTYENGTPEVVVGTSKVPLGDVTTITQ